MKRGMRAESKYYIFDDYSIVTVRKISIIAPLSSSA